MEIDDIISYHDVVTAEKASLQKGMNYGVGRSYSVFLMSLREGAPYADALDPVTGMLTYEGHDEPQQAGRPNSKEVDQPLTTPKGSWTENGKFFRAAMHFKSGLREKPELIKVYEKISRGIWSYKGFFELIDANIESDGKRKVFKFSLKPVEKKSFGRVIDLPHNRLIPTPVKVEVWRRDRGQCCNAVQRRTFTSITTFHFRKAGAASLRRMFDCSAPNVICRNQTRFCRSRRGFSLAHRPRRTFTECAAEEMLNLDRMLILWRISGN